MYNYYGISYFIIFIVALYVSLVDTNYNITEGTKLNIKIVASRAFSTNFKIHIISKLVTATGKLMILMHN